MVKVVLQEYFVKDITVGIIVIRYCCFWYCYYCLLVVALLDFNIVVFFVSQVLLIL